MSNCKYLINLGEGNVFEFPSSLLSENEGNIDDFKRILKSWLVNPDNALNINTILESYEPQVVIPSEIQDTIIGQYSTDYSKLFVEGDLKKQLFYLFNAILKPIKSVSPTTGKMKSDYDFSRKNLLVVNMPESIPYQYLPEQDLILLNKSNIDNSENVLKALIEMSLVKYLKIDNPVQAILSGNQEVIDFLVKKDQSLFTADTLKYLFADTVNLKGLDILKKLANSPELWKAKYTEFQAIKSSEAIDLNYLPAERVPVSELKTGDLIVRKTKSGESTSMFIDYYIDPDGKYYVKIPDAHPIGLQSSTVLSRKLVGNALKFPEYTIKKGKEIKADMSDIDSINFVFNTTKRGDIIVTADGKEHTIANIQGGSFIFQGSSKPKKFPDYQRGAKAGNKITSVIFNENYHPELTEKVDLSNYYPWSTDIQTVAVQEGDFVEYNHSGESFIGKVLDTTYDKVIVGDVTASNFIQNISVIDRQKIETIKTKFTNFIPFVEQLQKENIEDLKKLVITSSNPQFRGDLNTTYNIIEAYKSFSYQKGDLILQNNKLQVVTGVFNNNYIQLTDGSEFDGHLVLDLTTDNDLVGATIFTKRAQDETFQKNSLEKNRFIIDNKVRLGLESIVSRVFKLNLEGSGRLFVASENDWDKISAEKLENGTNKWVDITELYKTNTDDVIYSYRYKNTGKGVLVRAINDHLTEIDNSNENFPVLFKHLITGSFVRETNGLIYWQVEKIIEDKALISYSYWKDNKINTIKKFIDADSDIYRIFVPYNATKVIARMNDSLKKSIDIKELSDYDSPELLVNMADILKEKYDININFVHDAEMQELTGETNLRAVVLNGEYFINVDRASIADPLHEFVHIVLGSMKSSDYEKYVELVSTVQNHKLFAEITKGYQEIQLDQLEETFIRLFTETVRSKILVDNIFTTNTFTNALKDSVKEMFDLQESLEETSAYELLDSRVKDVLVEFNSSLIENPTSFYNKDNAVAMMGISTTLRNLIKEGNLKEMCNG